MEAVVVAGGKVHCHLKVKTGFLDLFPDFVLFLLGFPVCTKIEKFGDKRSHKVARELVNKSWNERSVFI